VSAGWQSKALVDVCEIKPPKGEAKRKLNEEKLVSFVPMEDLGIDQKYFEPKVERTLGQVAGSYAYFADGDVLLAKITPCFENGKLGIARGLTNGVGFGSSEYVVFRPNGDLSNEYLYYFLLQDSFRVEGTRTMSGAVGHKRIEGIYRALPDSASIPARTKTHCRHSGRGLCWAGDRDCQRREKSQECA
jgi:type I restriction enzyme, S subunit